MLEAGSREARMQAKIERKQNLVVSKSKPPMFRSQKPNPNTKNVVKTKVPQEVEDMRKFLGIDPMEW